MSEIDLIQPDWPVPAPVRAVFTTRRGGVSGAPYDALNIGAHVGDRPEAVERNRELLCHALKLPAAPRWLAQRHGTRVIELEVNDGLAAAQADGAVARHRGLVCAIQVADCVPVLFAARDASAIGAAHAGWRGLAAGILEATVQALAVPPPRVMAWLGPAIGTAHFEVGEEVRRAFLERDAAAASAFEPNAAGRWQCDLGALVRRRLAALGIGWVSGGSWCTFADPARFFSYRREPRCGRMAALIWLER